MLGAADILGDVVGKGVGDLLGPDGCEEGNDVVLAAETAPYIRYAPLHASFQ
jgi:hypothetical protein